MQSAREASDRETSDGEASDRRTSDPETSALMSVRSISCGYEMEHPVIDSITFDVAQGEVVCVLGPNGVGKTTLFKSILGQLPLFSGSVYLDGQDIKKVSQKHLAQTIAYVPQAHVPPFPFLVGDVVAMGRTAHLSLFAMPSTNDDFLAHEALEKLGIADLYARPYTEISGGERQLVLIARALAQQTKMLVMDEPTANLDFGNQVRVLERICDLAADGLAILMTTHFPDHALQCSSKCIVLESPESYTIGRAEKVITSESLRRIYGIEAEVKSFQTLHGIERACLPCVRKGAGETRDFQDSQNSQETQETL